MMARIQTPIFFITRDVTTTGLLTFQSIDSIFPKLLLLTAGAISLFRHNSLIVVLLLCVLLRIVLRKTHAAAVEASSLEMEKHLIRLAADRHMLCLACAHCENFSFIDSHCCYNCLSACAAG